MTHTVVGLFDNRTEAQAAMQELVQQGFMQEHIDVSNRKMSDTNATGVSGGDYTPDTVSTGTGGRYSNDTGSGIGNFFSSLFGDDESTVQNYTNAASDADAILTVQVDSAERAQLAADILDRNGAIDVDERGMQYNQQNVAQTSGTTENRTQTEGNMSIPVIEEQLQVGKQQVERGGARIRSRVIEKPVEETVRLREEHIVVNRHPVNRDVTDADLRNFKEGEIELTERAEQAVVGKQARVVEEVEIGKNVTEREETVRDTVRRTDVEVQETDTDVTGTTDVNTRTARS
jgi:uncharacterized protein (TIGR02271 family)